MNIKAKLYLYRGLFLATIIKFFADILGFKLPPVLSVFGIIKNGKKILALNLSYKKGYALPGGLAEINETLEEALKREIFEETGLNISESKYFKSYKTKKRIYAVTSVCFLVKTSGAIKSSFEGEIKWVTPEEFYANSAYDDNKMAIRDYMKNE